MFCGGHQPRAGIIRNAGPGPLLKRGDERIVCEILGGADVARNADEAGDQARRLDAPDRVDGAVRCGVMRVGGHGQRISQHFLRGAAMCEGWPAALAATEKRRRDAYFTYRCGEE
ncbi:MAG: hypothetical protein WBL50_24085 [Candidatus Acidiferrum sp.]